MAVLGANATVIGLVSGAISVTALAVTVWLAIQFRRLLANQKLVLGEIGRDDLVAHAGRLHQAFVDLSERVERGAQLLESRVDRVEESLTYCFSRHAIVRYDAYGEMSGQQSSSVALVDAHGDGLLLSSIAHRHGTQLYCRRIIKGQGEHQLSPEEQQALEAALASNSTDKRQVTRSQTEGYGASSTARSF